jgi:hypothetical protein
MHATPNGKPAADALRHAAVALVVAAVVAAHRRVLRVAARQAVEVAAQAMVKRPVHARVVVAAVGNNFTALMDNEC